MHVQPRLIGRRAGGAQTSDTLAIGVVAGDARCQYNPYQAERHATCKRRQGKSDE